MNVAIIPARGGSKRIPRKNIRNFCGKPMIAWSIEEAIRSGCFDRVVVSTDDEEVAEISERYGAEVPFRRPKNLADDLATTVPVIAHAVAYLKAYYGDLNSVCCLYPTAPFVSSEDLRNGLERLLSGQFRYVLSVTRYPYPVQRALRNSLEGRLEMFYPEHSQTRSQNLEEAWHDAGQFYLASAETWLAEDPVFEAGVEGIELPRYRVQDIDTLEDWRQAELMFGAIYKQS